MLYNYFEAKRIEREKQAKRDAALNMTSGLAMGILLGAAIGILFAPKSGSELRGDIGRTTKETYGTVKKQVKNIIDETGEKIKDICDCTCDIGDLDDVFADVDDSDWDKSDDSDEEV